MRLMWYSFKVVYVAGKSLVTADALSRAPQFDSNDVNWDFVNLVECHMDDVVKALPVSTEKLDFIRKAIAEDEVCKKIVDFCLSGWPKHVNYDLVDYFYITFKDRLLLNGSRILIPVALQKDMLEKIHADHQGINKCRERAHFSVWWPVISKDIKFYVNNCHVCAQNRLPPTKPMLFTKTPDYPWQNVACDLFESNSKAYLLLIIF